MARPLSKRESAYLFWRNDGRRMHRGKVSGAWYKRRMARARRIACRREVVEILELDLVEHRELWEGLADA